VDSKDFQVSSDAPEAPQPPVDHHEDSTAPSEETGGSSPEASVEEETAPAPPVEGVAPRPEAGSTNPKTAKAPPPGVPLQPINATRDPGSAPTPKRPASRIKEAQKRQKALREQSLSG
jgi:hypothetical protein